jgi:hypothetical protein
MKGADPIFFKNSLDADEKKVPDPIYIEFKQPGARPEQNPWRPP